jgi:hypothetical protein
MKNLTISVILVFLLPLTVSAQEMGPVTGDAENGALLYYQHGCYGCHGFSGYGRQDLNNTGSPFLLNEQLLVPTCGADRMWLRYYLRPRCRIIRPTC